MGNKNSKEAKTARREDKQVKKALEAARIRVLSASPTNPVELVRGIRLIGLNPETRIATVIDPEGITRKTNLEMAHGVMMFFTPERPRDVSKGYVSFQDLEVAASAGAKAWWDFPT